MSVPSDERTPESDQPTNGSAAAAVLAAGLGCFALSVLAFAGDKSSAIRAALNFYKPTGPLSGVATLGTAAWLAAWILLELRWRSRTVSARKIATLALGLLGAGLLLTFPPVVDLF